MVERVKTRKRPYDSTGRQAAARSTRLSSLRSAIELFTTLGYAATSMRAIADHAGVSVQTIYATFGNKRTVLAEALDTAITGDDQPITVDERDWMHDVWHARTGRERLRAYAAAVARIMEGAGDMFMAVTAAALADTELIDLEQDTQRRRRDGAERVVASIHEVSDLTPGLSDDEAIDVLWMLNSPAVHHHMVHRAGWSRERYADWLGDTFVRELLPAAT